MKIFFTFLLIFSFGCTTLPPIQDRKAWKKLDAPEEISHLAHASCFADTENFYVFSGIDENSEGPFNNIGYTYNLLSHTWKKWSNESGPSPIQNFTSIRVGDDYYVFGGQEEAKRDGTNYFYSYSLNQNKWTLLPSTNLVDGRWRASSAANKDGILVYGGKGSKESVNTAFYDFSQRSWKILATPSELGSRVSALVTAKDDKVIILGGFNGPTPQDTAFAFDLKSGEWTKIPNSILGERVNPKFIKTESHLYILGGATHFDEQVFGASFNLERGDWKEIPHIKNFRDFKGFELANIQGEGLLLWGGRQAKSNRYNDKLYFLSFESNDWIELKPENSPPGTVGGCLASNQSKDVFAIGGIKYDQGKGLSHLSGLWILSAMENP